VEQSYLWSDAWLFQAIVIASHDRAASVTDIIAVADAVNHALPTDDELHGAFVRLSAGGLIREVAERFQVSEAVPSSVKASVVGRGWKAGRDAASEFLSAEPWTPETNVRDPRNHVKYPGLTTERIQTADREYRERLKRRRS
jgi:hypothetical protein